MDFPSRDVRDAYIVAQARVGESFLSLGKRLGLTNARVGQIAKAAGIRRGQGWEGAKRNQGSDNPRWKGGRTVAGAGYVGIRDRTSPSGYRYEHIVVAEKALGKPLPKKAEVHHFNGDKTDNRGSNLVVCPDHAYHRLLHQRQSALDACGNPDWRKCKFCRHYDAPANLYISPNRGGAHHRSCFNEYDRRRKL